MGGPEGAVEEEAPVTAANTDSSRRAPGCPAGHEAGSPDSAIGRFSSKVSSQVWQRYS